jgi:hypothetical protein
MTKQEAKELSLEIWGHLKAHPDIKYKDDLPQELFAKIKGLYNFCPLCAVCWHCRGCPLGSCTLDGDVFVLWVEARSDAERKAAAAEIVRLVKAWEPGVGGMKYTALVSFGVFVEADSPKEAHESILNKIEYSGLETDDIITIGEITEVEE